MAETAAIQALSSIAAPADSSGRVEAPSGRAPLWEWFLPGHVLELSAESTSPTASARSSVAARLVAQAQAQGETVVWVEGSVGLYPPDLAAVGVDLSALVVVRPFEDPRVPASAVAEGASVIAEGASVIAEGASVIAERASPRPLSPAQRAVRAAEVLLRSGAFGLLVLDLTAGAPGRATAWLAKLHGLLRLHASRLLVLSAADAEAPSLGPSVSLRIEPRCRRISADRWVIEHTVLKSKLGREALVRPDVRTAPEGAALLSDRPTLSKVEHEGAQEHCA